MPDGAAAPFVKKFEQAPRDGPGPSRVIEIRATAKDRDLESDGVHLATDLSPGPATGSMRSRNDIAHDQERDLAQGNRFLAPPELRSQFEAYKSRVSRWDGPRARPAPSGAKAVGR